MRAENAGLVQTCFPLTFVLANDLGGLSFTIQSGDGEQTDFRIRQISAQWEKVYLPVIVRGE